MNKKKYYLEKKSNLSELENKKLDILLDEKKRVENHMIFIIKTYSYIYSFLFIYTGFVTKEFIQLSDPSIEGTNFIRISLSILGLFLIVVISLFGKYGTIGIAHIIKKRLKYTYEINKIIKRSNENGIEIEHFLKIPVIYTWTTTAIIAGSIFYFLLIFDSENDIAISFTIGVSIFGLLIFPRTNIRFFNILNNYSKELGQLDGIENKQKLINKNRSNLDLTILRLLIYIILIYIEVQLYVYDNIIDYRFHIYSSFFSILILIEYLYIKRKTNRRTIFYQVKKSFHF